MNIVAGEIQTVVFSVLVLCIYIILDGLEGDTRIYCQRC